MISVRTIDAAATIRWKVMPRPKAGLRTMHASMIAPMTIETASVASGNCQFAMIAVVDTASHLALPCVC